MWKIEVVAGSDLDIDEVAELYRSSTLAQRRPVNDRERFAAMLTHANLVLVARLDGRLIGISRCVSDFSYVTYLSDLAVAGDMQRRGVGRDLLRATQAAAPGVKIVLLSAPAATDYYPGLGFTRHESAWVLTERL